MLNLLLGRNGTNTDAAVLKIIGSAASAGRPVLYIVPEQYTVFAERSVTAACPPELLRFIEVTNFSRLSNIVARNTGIRPGKALSDGGKYILMSKAFEAAADRLQVYKRTLSGDFIMHLARLYDEIGFYRVNVSEVREKLSSLGDSVTKQKLSDLFYILDCFQAASQGEKTGTAGELAFLEEQLRSFTGFSEHTVVFSGFDFLTPEELAVTSELMNRCKEMNFSLCTDTLTDTEGGYGILSGVKALGVLLRAEAGKKRVSVTETAVTELRQDFSPEIEFLEQNLFAVGAPQYEEKTKDISVYSARDMYDEAEFIACTVSRLVREKGWHYRDFSVIGRKMEEYKGILDTVFFQYGIPCFEDARSELLTKPLVVLILSAVNIALYGFETKNVLSVLKSGLLDISEDDICALQGYVYVWNINYSKWTGDDWFYHPDGFSAELTDSKKEELATVNRTRRAVVEPLVRFCEVCKKGGSLNLAQALYTLLTDYKVPEKLKEQAESFRESGETALAMEEEQLWNLFAALLDELYQVSKEDALDLRHFKEYLELSFKSVSIGKLPTSLDEISMGNADRVRVRNPKCVFVVGVNDGVFPKTYNDDGILTDKDKKLLGELGAEISKTTEDSTFEERFFCYKALTTPTERLYLSYYKTGLDGREAMPSYLVAALEELFPNLTKKDFAESQTDERIERIAPAFDRLALLNRQNGGLTDALTKYFENKPYYGELLEKVSGIRGFGRNDRLTVKENISGLYGHDLKFSPTRIETYADCSFRHYCRYGLKAEKKERAELGSLQIGSFVHSVLEQAVREAGNREGGLGRLSDMEIKRLCARLSKEYLIENLGGEQNARFQYIYRRLSKTLVTLLMTLRDEFADSLFAPTDFELPVGINDSVKPVHIPLDGGGQLYLTGVVDRVDVYDKGDVKYIRVVDYKTGTKNFKISDIVNGLNLQMLVYLFSIWKNGKAYYGKKVLPAGILYYPARRDILSLERGKTPEDIAKERGKKMRMNGLLIDDRDVLSAMEPSLAGRFLPVKEGSKGLTGGASLVTLEELSKLYNYIEKLLMRVGNEIKAGEIAVNPISDTTYNACNFCDMRAICGYEKGRNKWRKYEKKSKDQLMAELGVSENE